MKELEFITTDINYLNYGAAKEIVGRQGTEDRERPDETIIVFEAIAKSKPEKTKEGMLSGEAWCRAHILCDCGETHVIESDTTIDEQMKGVIEGYPDYITRLLADPNDSALIVNFLYTVDPKDTADGIDKYTFRKPDGGIRCIMNFDTKGQSEEQINGFIQDLVDRGATFIDETPKPKAKKTTKKK